jgi:hypothetical protein
MDSRAISKELVRGLHAIRSLLDGMTQDEAQSKPDSESWSALEVLCHLLDEEREDFRMHIQQVFTDPQEVWHPIDPPLWVIERRYQDQSMEAKFAEFCQERDKSLRWLDGMHTVDWGHEITAPFGGISAGSLLVSWAAHDNLHIRQLIEIRQFNLNMKSKPFSTRYAGEW